LDLVPELKAALDAKSNVEVVRRGLRLLKEVTDRESLRQAYMRDSLAVRESVKQEIEELDALVADGFEDRRRFVVGPCISPT
jgi:Arc/MetJ-type ribon-helix-helix transcriptional regulator